VEYHVSGHQLSGFTVEIPDKDRFCFNEEFEGTTKCILEYKVIKGGNLDVDVTIESPNGKKLYAVKRKRGDRVVFEASRGAYTFCISNEFSTITHKLVYVDLRPADSSGSMLAHEVEGGNAAPKVNTRAEESVETVHKHGTKVMQYQVQYRQNEARGRHAADTLNRHVFWWPLAQSIAILVTGLGQLFVLKWFFTEKRNMTAGKAASLLLHGGNEKTGKPSSEGGSLPLRP